MASHPSTRCSLLENTTHSSLEPILMHLSIPSPFDLDNPGDFFRAFIRMNSKADGFTHRSFADAIGWPVSYLSDVAQSRKSLTPARAIEFARFVGLDPLAAERLIFMGLHDVLPDSLRSSMEPALSSRHAQQYEGDATTVRYSGQQNVMDERMSFIQEFWYALGIVALCAKGVEPDEHAIRSKPRGKLWPLICMRS